MSDVVPTLSVVVPAYNEAGRLGATLSEMLGALRDDPRSWELIVVDDGSADGTARLAGALAAHESRLRVIRIGPNRGKGHAVRVGVLATRGRRVLVCDADGATPFGELERLGAELDRGATVAIGSRAGAASRVGMAEPGPRRTMARWGNTMIRALLLPGIADTQCGFKLFDGPQARRVLGLVRLDGWAFDIEMLYLFRRSGARIREVPVRWDHQPGSRLRLSAYLTVARDLARLCWRYRARAPRWTRADLAIAATYLLGAVLLLFRVWADPAGRYLVDGGQDEFQWQSFFAIVAHAVAGGHNPLFTTLINHPDGVNLAANTSMPGLSVPLAPLTLLCGPAVTYLLALTVGMAGTAFAWYRVFRRDGLARHRLAAAVGGACCGFGPPVVSHANAHPNFVVLFVLAFIARRVVRLAGSRHPVRDGVVLGVLVAYQVLLGGEALLLAATALAVYLAAWAVARPRAVLPALRRLLTGGAVAVGVCAVLAGPVLWFQFAGPGSYLALRHTRTGQDLFALTSFATRSLAGDPATAASLSFHNPTEQNGFLGWPLLLVLAGIVLWQRRRVHVRVLAATTVVLCVLSLGDPIVVGRHDTGIPGPWRLLADLPLYESVIISRIMLVCLPAVGALLAIGLDALLSGRAGTARRRARWPRIAALVAIFAALLPIVPTPLAAADAPPVPALITSGRWRDYVRPGHTLVPVPVPSVADATATRWQTVADEGFALPAGYFIGPYGADGAGSYGIYPRPTARLLAGVADTGRVPTIGAQQRRDAAADLRYWHADAVLLPAAARHHDALLTALWGLLGPGRQVGDDWVWRIRGLP